jgi:hypothetical protein
MMTFTTPSGVGPFGVLVFFTLCYIACLGILVALCYLFFTLRNKLSKTHISNISKKSYYYGSVLAFAPVILIAMQSFGNIGVLEIGLVVVTMLVACFLVAKRIL